jgi:hypothetical protein
MPNDATQLTTLPEKLEPKRAALVAAMHDPSDPIGLEWPLEEVKLARAYAPESIAQILIDALPAHIPLRGAPIAYLWRPSITRHGKITLGTASVASAKIAHFGDVAFLIEINYEAWQLLSYTERVALMDHELCHCIYDVETERPKLCPHDVEEFGSIVARWGLWKPDLERFGKIVRDTPQLPLFERPAEAASNGKGTSKRRSKAKLPIEVTANALVGRGVASGTTH